MKGRAGTVVLLELAQRKFHGFKKFETTHEIIIDIHDSTIVIKFSTVIGGGEDGNKLTITKELIAILDDHMGTTDEIEVMPGKEFPDDLTAKAIGDATFIILPV